MKQTVYLGDFIKAFKDMGRENQFSYDGLEALFDMLERYDDDYELDVIALCCDYTELPVDEIENQYNLDGKPVFDYLVENTFFVKLDNNSVLFQNF